MPVPLRAAELREEHNVPPGIRALHDEFWQCAKCRWVAGLQQDTLHPPIVGVWAGGCLLAPVPRESPQMLHCKAHCSAAPQRPGWMRR